MCYFLPVHHLGIVFWGRVEGQNITIVLKTSHVTKAISWFGSANNWKMTFDATRFTGLIPCRTFLLAGAGFWDAMLVATASTTTQVVWFYNLIYGASWLRGNFFFFAIGRCTQTPTFRVSQTFVLGHAGLPQMPLHGWCFPQGSLMNRPLLINLLGERHLLCLWSADLWYRYQIGRDCKWDMWNHNPELHLELLDRFTWSLRNWCKR